MSSRGSYDLQQSFSEGIGAMSEAILSWEYSLRNELEIIHTCVKLIDGSVLAGLQGTIQSITASIEEEIQSLKDIATQLSRSKGSLSEQSLEEYSLRRLKYNKLILQVEKLYSSAPELQDVVNRFPRSKFVLQNETQQQQQRINNGNTPSIHIRSPSQQQLQKSQQPPQLMMSKQLQQQQQSQLLSLGISNNLNNPNSQNSNLQSRLAIPVLPSTSVSATFKPPLSQSSLQSILSPMSVAIKAGVADTIKDAAKSREATSDLPTIEQIRRELVQIKTQVSEVNKKLDTHDHQEYALELDQLRRDNCLIAHDYKILKNDNTELMHSLRMLQKLAMEVKMQNEDMLRQLHSSKYETEGDIDDHRKSNYQIREDANQWQQQQQQQQQSPSQLYERPSSAITYARTQYNNNNNNGSQFFEDKQPVERVLTRTNSRTNVSGNQNNNSHNNANRGSEQQQYESYSQQQYHQRSSGQKRQFIEENRENDVNVDLLSSWARKRIVDQ